MRNKGKREQNYFKKFPKKLLLNSQRRPGSGSGSVIRKNSGSGSALNQGGSTTLQWYHPATDINVKVNFLCQYRLSRSTIIIGESRLSATHYTSTVLFHNVYMNLQYSTVPTKEVNKDQPSYRNLSANATRVL
jgi:hypothetical protein